MSVEIKMEFVSKNNVGVHKNAARSSCRQKRPLITRNKDFLGNIHIKNGVVDNSVNSDNCIRYRQICECNQNICDLNTCETQKTKLITEKEDKCTGMGKDMQQRSLM